jgi:hypothetical protein
MTKKNIGKKITIDELAAMVMNGFSELKIELKNDLSQFREEVREQFRGVNARIDDLADKKVGYDEFNRLERRVVRIEEGKA